MRGVRLLVCAVALLACVRLSSGRSSGLLSTCDLSPVMGPGNVMWTNGVFGRTKTPSPPRLNGNAGTTISGQDSGIMRWVNSPTASAAYTIRSGDGANDPTTYTPGVLNAIHIRVSELDMRFIGLLMYATNVLQPSGSAHSETQIGTWQVPAGSSYQVPYSTCGATSVTHKNAMIKPVHTILYFNPPAGSGTLKFRVLIKQGEQNHGSFYWPQNELTLSEGPASTRVAVASPGQSSTAILPLSGDGVIQTIVGAYGRSCADVCGIQSPMTPYCHANALLAISDVPSLRAAVDGFVACKAPFIANCAFAGAPTVSADGFCTFRSTNLLATCPAAYHYFNSMPAANLTAAEPDVCYTAPTATAQAICMCTNNIANKGSNPYIGQTSTTTGGSTPTGSSTASQTSTASPTSSTASPAGSSTASHTSSSSTASHTSGSTSSSASNGSGSNVQSDTGNNGIDISAAGSLQPSTSAAVTVLAGVFALASSASSFKAPRLLLAAAATVTMLAALATPAVAHNYIKSQHRATIAAVSEPCQAQIGNQPHVQVVADQVFEMEWSSGHGDYTNGPFYFVIVPKSAYAQLAADNITDVIAAYIAAAPLSAYRNQSAPVMWEKHQLHLTGDMVTTTTSSGATQNANYANYFKEVNGMPMNDPSYIQRTDAAYIAKSHPSQYMNGNANNVYQVRFLDAFVARDIRISYRNPDYPWIEAVDAFDNPFVEHIIYSDQSNYARFTVPAFNGAGDYIAWFYWSGYKDCVDINVMPGTNPVVNRYGTVTAGTIVSVIKQDHCEWTYMGDATTQAYRLDPNTMDAQQCISECASASQSGNCAGVQVVRATNLAGTLPYPPNIPYIAYGSSVNGAPTDGSPDPCLAFSVNQRKVAGCTNTAIGGYLQFSPALADSDYICFGTVPVRDQDFQTTEDFTISTDPQDPAYYSTCYMYEAGGGFLNIAPYTYSAPGWTAADKCLQCGFHDSMYYMGGNSINIVPNWAVPGNIVDGDSTTTGCPNCDVLASQNTVAQEQPLLSGANTPNAGV